MKHIVVTFDLVNPTLEQYRKAYEAFYSVGLHSESQNAGLPMSTLLGIWHDDAVSMELLRNILVNALTKIGVTPRAIFVASFDYAAWFGPKVNQTT